MKKQTMVRKDEKPNRGALEHPRADMLQQQARPTGMLLLIQRKQQQQQSGGGL